MPENQLSNSADEDLSELYAYSFAEFGENRAAAYFDSLENCLQRLAINPNWA